MTRGRSIEVAQSHSLCSVALLAGSNKSSSRFSCTLSLHCTLSLQLHYHFAGRHLTVWAAQATGEMIEASLDDRGEWDRFEPYMFILGCAVFAVGQIVLLNKVASSWALTGS